MRFDYLQVSLEAGCPAGCASRRREIAPNEIQSRHIFSRLTTKHSILSLFFSPKQQKKKENKVKENFQSGGQFAAAAAAGHTYSTDKGISTTVQVLPMTR